MGSLAFPCGVASGFDPSHPLAPGVRFSGVALGGSFLDIIGGKAGAVTGALTAGVRGDIGPFTKTTATSTDRVSFTGRPATNDTSITMAAIVSFSSISGTQMLCSSSGANSGWSLGSSGGLLTLFIQGGNVSSGFTLVAGVPYFCVASGNSGATAFVVLRLDTGKLLTSTGAGLSSTAPNGTYQIANAQSAFTLNGFIAAAAISNFFNSQSALVRTASDPWSYWYPNR